MNPEVSAFLAANGTAVVLVGGALAAIGLVQWRKVRIAEQELEYKQRLIEQGFAVPEVERAVSSRVPVRRGLIDQFGALSGGTKAGIIIGFVIVMTVTVSCIGGAIHGIAYWSHVRNQPPHVQQSYSEEMQSAGAHVDPIRGDATFLDLQPVANQRLNAGVAGDQGHSFATMPQKRQEFRGVPFQIGPSYVRLRGNNHAELPAEAKGIRVGFKLDKLHIFHGTEFGAFGDSSHRFHVPEGTEIGQYRVQFADKSERVIPVVYGEDVRDVWNWDRSRATNRGSVVWTGRNPSATREGVGLRVYLTSWQNPRPDVEIASVDYVSEGTTAATPFCIAITAERTRK